jgi:hypothetical protein
MEVFEQHSRFFGCSAFPNDDRAFESPWIQRRPRFAAGSWARREIEVIHETQVEKLGCQSPAADAGQIPDVELSQSPERSPS